MRYVASFTMFARLIPPSDQHPRGFKVWYYRARNPDGTRTNMISTGKTNKGEALAFCLDLERNGTLIPDRNKLGLNKDMTFATLAKDFWNWGTDGRDGSKYVRARLAHSDPEKPMISKHYCDSMARQVELHILPAFRRHVVANITPQDLDDFQLRLRDEKDLSGKSINNIVSVFRTMLAEAYRAGILLWDPGQKRIIMAMGYQRKQRGHLTMAEVKRLFSESALKNAWGGHKLYRAISFVAAATGMRQGEVLALRDGDVFKDHLHVEHSYDPHYGLMPTKTKEKRDVAISEKVYRVMKPFLGTGGFVFSNNGGKKPVTGNLVTEALYAAIDLIGVKDRVERNVTFHSWRHFWNTALRAKGVPDSMVRQITGHATEAMTENYTKFSQEDFAPVLKAQREVFGE